MLCKRCGRSFDTKEALEQHVGDKHPATATTAVAGQHTVAEGVDPPRLTSRPRSPALTSLDDILPHGPPPSPAAAEAPPCATGRPTHVSCNDCGDTFKCVDALFQHQYDCFKHTRVARTRMPPGSSELRECYRCPAKFGTAPQLEDHFMVAHPLREIVLDSSEEDGLLWDEISSNFMRLWGKQETGPPVVHKIWRVYNLGWRRRQFEEYRNHLKAQIANMKTDGSREEELEEQRRVLGDGNELRRFHGTTVKCTLGNHEGGAGRRNAGAVARDIQQALCDSEGCGLCGIIKEGFKRSKCRGDLFQRFGTGIYVSEASGKSNEYVRCRQWGAGEAKVMLVCKVLAGRVHRSAYNMQGLDSPPAGFHSVQGVPGPVLNYDELVVYDDRAILPSYIILYSTPATQAMLMSQGRGSSQRLATLRGQ